MKNTRIVKIVVSMLLLISIIVGFSYARMEFKVESQKVNLVQSGCLKISMTDQGNVSITNTMPMTDDLGLENKPYYYTITNQCDLTAYYESTLNILNTSNIENISKVKVSLKGDSYLSPTIINLLSQANMYETYNDISNSYLIDKGYLQPNQEKTFEVRMWIDNEVEEFTGNLESKIIINTKAADGPSYNTNTSGFTIINNNNIKTKGEYDPNYSFVAPYTDNNKINNQTSGLFKYDNNRYYFRGQIDNNYIVLGKYKEDETITYLDYNNETKTITHKKDEDIIWRIVGVNEDGSLKLILNDLIGYSKYNEALATYDFNTSNIYPIINNWINKHLTEETKYLSNINFCQDGQNITSNENTIYASYTRNITSKNPSIDCEEEYTVNNNIGLLTIDEASLAGWKHNAKSTENYLFRAYNYWTLTPMINNSKENIGVITTSGISYDEIDKEYAIVPVINLSKDAIITGTGTENNKYQVIGLYDNADTIYLDNIAPTIVEAYTTEENSNQEKSIIIMVKDNNEGTGISGYIIKETNEVPLLSDEWISTTNTKIITETKYQNGTYYIWIKDNSGNISKAYTLIIDNIDTITPTCLIKTDNDGITSKSKTLTIITTDEDVLENGYSWDNITYKENKTLTITTNKTYTAYVKDKAGNIGNCSITITSIN